VPRRSGRRRCVEAGTQAGMAYRLRSKGLPRLGEGGTGPALPHPRLDAAKLTAEQRKLLEQLSEVEDAAAGKRRAASSGDTIRRALDTCERLRLLQDRDGGDPATVVKRGDGMLAFKDLNAQAPTHILVIPTTHVGTLNDAKDAATLGNC